MELYICNLNKSSVLERKTANNKPQRALSQHFFAYVYNMTHKALITDFFCYGPVFVWHM